MRSRFPAKISALFCFCVLIFAQRSEGQTIRKRSADNKSKVCDCKVEYEDVISFLFPRYRVGLGKGYALILNYTLPNRPEIQINIFHIERGRVEVDLYKHQPRSDYDSVSLQLQDIQEKNCNASFSEITKQIKVEKTRISLTEEEVLKIRNGFFDVFKKSNEFEGKHLENMKSDFVTIRLDSPFYLVRYNGGGNISLGGEGNSIDENPSEDEPPFIEWMREVYKLVKARKV